MWITTATLKDILQTMDAYMGLQGSVCMQLHQSPARYNISEECKSCYFSTEMQNHVTVPWLGHHNMFQAVLHKTPTTKAKPVCCMLDWFRKACQTKNQYFASDTVHSSGLVTSHTSDSSTELLSIGVRFHRTDSGTASRPEGDWIQLGTRDVNFSSNVGIDIQPATCAVSSSAELWSGEWQVQCRRVSGSDCDPQQHQASSKPGLLHNCEIIFFMFTIFMWVKSRTFELDIGALASKT